MNAAFWAVVTALCLVCEGITLSLTAIWFAAGGLAALFAALLGAPKLVQWLIFILLSAVMLVFTRPAAKKLLPEKAVPTNADLNIGRSAMVIEDIGKTGGRVRLDGVDWAARSPEGEDIAAGETVIVTEVCSAKLTVKRPQPEDEP